MNKTGSLLCGKSSQFEQTCLFCSVVCTTRGYLNYVGHVVNLKHYQEAIQIFFECDIAFCGQPPLSIAVFPH